VGLLDATENVATAQGNVVLALDGFIVINSDGSDNNPGQVDGQQGWGGFGRFDYAGGGNPTTITVGTPTTPGLGRYDAFTISEPGVDGSGVGINFMGGNINSPVSFVGAQIEPVNPVTANMFPLLDLATFGANFDANEYVAELVYKPLPGNTATQLNVTLDTVDGFANSTTGRAGEQWQWGFFGLINTYMNTQANGDLDADGFAVVQSFPGSLSDVPGEFNFNGQSFMYTLGQGQSNPTGDGQADFDQFAGDILPVPNGAVQIHLQTVYGAQTVENGFDNWEIKALRIRKINPDPLEVARMDGKSGFSLRFGTPFERSFDGFINIDGTDYDPPVTDQLIRFDENGFLQNNSFIINTDDDGAIGGAHLWQSGATTAFDATDAMVEVRARLTAPVGEQAESIQVYVKDRDGNGTGEVGDFGGDEYVFTVPLGSFNESMMTTISLPFSGATVQQAQELATPGDGLLTDFNLYSLGFQTLQGAGLVDLEVEYIRVVLSAPPGVQGDYNENGIVDAADYTAWRDRLGQSVTLPNTDPGDMDGVVTEAEYNFWVSRFGATMGAAALSTNGNVPEPGAWVLAMLALALLRVRCRDAR
jgi:hypothetical protein